MASQGPIYWLAATLTQLQSHNSSSVDWEDNFRCGMSSSRGLRAGRRTFPSSMTASKAFQVATLLVRSPYTLNPTLPTNPNCSHLVRHALPLSLPLRQTRLHDPLPPLILLYLLGHPLELLTRHECPLPHRLPQTGCRAASLPPHRPSHPRLRRHLRIRNSFLRLQTSRI